MLQVEAIRAALERLLGNDPSAILVGPDIGAWGGSYRATAGLYAAFGPARVLDMPRNAGAIFGIARGLALAGHTVVCEIAPEDAGRMAAAMAADAAQWLRQQRDFVGAAWGMDEEPAHRQHAPIGPIVVRVPVFGGSDIEGGLAGLCGDARVVVPSRPEDAFASILAGCQRAASVTFVLEHEALYRGDDGHAEAPWLDQPAEGLEFPAGCREVRAGDDALIVTWGGAVAPAVEAARVLAKEGYGIGVVDVGTLNPLPVAALSAQVERVGRTLVLADTGVSFARELACRLAEASFLSLEAPVRVVSTAGAEDPIEALRAVVEF